MKIINLYGGPGIGKSTTATALFSKMKLKGIKCEYVPEYAKEMVWDKRSNVLEDQLYLFAKQHRRLNILRDHNLDYVVTDSPLLLSTIYSANETGAFHALVWEKYLSFENVDIILKRVKPYAKCGRVQTEEQAIEIDEITRLIVGNTKMLSGERLYYVDGDEKAADNIIKFLGV